MTQNMNIWTYEYEEYERTDDTWKKEKLKTHPPYEWLKN